VSYAIHEQDGRGRRFLSYEIRDREKAERYFRALASHYPTKRITLVEVDRRSRRGPTLRVILTAGHARTFRTPREGMLRDYPMAPLDHGLEANIRKTRILRPFLNLADIIRGVIGR